MAYISLFQNEKWWSHSSYSYGYISMEYSHWREGTTQCYQINYSAGVSSGAYYKNGINIYVILDGVSHVIGSGVGTGSSSSWYQEGSGTYKIANKLSGHTGFYAAVYDAKTNALLWAGGTANLNVDNAYPSVTTNPYVTSRSINSLTFNIGGVNIASDVYWSLNNSSWNHAVAQEVTVYNLTANTGYTIYVQYRNQADHSLTTIATCTGTTLPQATIASPASGFSVNSGNSLSVGCTNNSGCPIKFFLETVDSAGNGVRRYTTNSTWDTSYTFPSTEVLSLLQYAPNSNSLKIRIGISTLADWENESHWSFNDGYLKVVNSNPTFASTQWTYQDVNSKTLALTGNNQIIIKGYSSVRGIITSANKAVAKNYATMTKYRLTIGNASKENNYSSSSTVNVGDLTATSNVFSMYAIDSRTNSTLAQRTVSGSNYKEYFNIAIDTSKTKATRKDKVGTETILNVEGKIWNASFGKVSNAIDTFTVEYKLTSESDDKYKAMTVDKPTLSGNTFKVNASVQGDLGADGFTVTSSFNIRVKVTDKLSSATSVITLSSGTPNLAIHKNGVAINQPYDTNDSASLQVKGTTRTDTLIAGDLITSRTFFYRLDAQGSSDNDGRFYKVAKIPATSDANAITLNIKGTIGSWTEKATINAQITNRGRLGVYLNYMGNVTAFDKQQLVIYQESDGSHTVYIKNTASYTSGLTLQVEFNAFYSQKPTIYNDYSYTKSPTGTLAYASTKQTVGDANGGNVLFDNASGAGGTIQLSESAANFKCLDISCAYRDVYKTIRVYNPNGKMVNNTTGLIWSSDGDLIQLGTIIFSISGATISFGNSQYSNIVPATSQNINMGAAQNYFKIYKVVGYR